jgi:hypothetical protein
VVLDWYSSLAESTAGEYHIGPYFAGGLGFGGLQAGGCRFDPSWMGAVHTVASGEQKQRVRDAPSPDVCRVEAPARRAAIGRRRLSE